MTDSRQRTRAYGLSLEIQDKILNEMTKTIENLRVKGKKCLLPFQKGRYGTLVQYHNSLNACYNTTTKFHKKMYAWYR